MKRTRLDHARNAILMGVIFLISGAIMLLLEAIVGSPEDWFFGRFFMIVGVMNLIIGGVGCRRVGAEGGWSRCLGPPERQVDGDRSWLRRVFGAPSASADAWWPASLVQGGFFWGVFGAAAFIVGMFWDNSVAVAMAPGLVAAGLGLVVIGGFWYLIVFLRR